VWVPTEAGEELCTKLSGPEPAPRGRKRGEAKAASVDR
jgi:hypothetical protein